MTALNNEYDKVYGCFYQADHMLIGNNRAFGDGIPATRGHYDTNRFSQRPVSSVIQVNYIG